MTNRWGRLAPLTGVLFAALAIVAIFANSSETPGANAGPLKVFAYYAKHRSEVETSAILFALAFIVLVLFAGALRAHLRRVRAAEALGSLVLAGAILMAVGAITVSGLEYGLAHRLSSLSLEEARTLNFLSNELFLPILAGGFIFGICAGIAILRGAPLPKWLGWAAIAIGIVTIVPPVSVIALLAFLIWTIVVSILMYIRADQLAAPPEPSAAALSSAA